MNVGVALPEAVGGIVLNALEMRCVLESRREAILTDRGGKNIRRSWNASFDFAKVSGRL